MRANNSSLGFVFSSSLRIKYAVAMSYGKAENYHPVPRDFNALIQTCSGNIQKITQNSKQTALLRCHVRNYAFYTSRFWFRTEMYWVTPLVFVRWKRLCVYWWCSLAMIEDEVIIVSVSFICIRCNDRYTAIDTPICLLKVAGH